MGVKGLLAVGNPPVSNWLLIVKGVIILLSVIVLALSAYALSLSRQYYYYGGGAPGYLIFLAIKTWIIYSAGIFIELRAPHFHYRIVFLIAYSISCIFWLSGWAWAASWASAVLALAYYRVDTNFGGAMAGNAAIGAVIWILCVINLIFFILASCRDNNAGGNVELGSTQKQDHNQGQAPYTQQPVYGQTQQPHVAQ